MNTQTRSSDSLIRKEFIIDLILVIGSVLLIAIGVEIWLRAFGDPKEAGLHHEIYPQGFICEPEPLLGWIGNPQVSGTLSFAAEDMQDMHVIMNSEGFWDIEPQIIKPSETKRILFLGDSFTIGFGISEKERFSDLIKDRLPADYEVINMGMWGYSTDQELLVLTEKGMKYSPDIVIVSMFLDDLFCSNLFSVNEGLYIKPKFNLANDNSLELGNVPIPNNHGKSYLLNTVLTRFYKLRNRLEMGSEFDSRGWISVFDKAYLKEKRYSLPLRLLSEMNAVSKANNSKFLLVIIPYKDQLYEQRINTSRGPYKGIPYGRLDLSLPQKVVRLFCKKSGIPVLDLLPVFKVHNSQKPLFFKKDLHWTKEGHRLAAEQILTYLKESNYLL